MVLPIGTRVTVAIKHYAQSAHWPPRALPPHEPLILGNEYPCRLTSEFSLKVSLDNVGLLGIVQASQTVSIH